MNRWWKLFGLISLAVMLTACHPGEGDENTVPNRSTETTVTETDSDIRETKESERETDSSIWETEESGWGKFEGEESLGAAYRAENLNMVSELGPQDIATDGKVMYIYSLQINWDDSTTYRHHRIVRCEMDGSEQKEVVYIEERVIKSTKYEYSTGYKTSIYEIAVTNDGGLLVIFQGTETHAKEYWMAKYDAEGKELWRTVIGELGSFLLRPVCLESSIYIGCEDRILVYDQNGTVEKQIQVGAFPEAVRGANLERRAYALIITEQGNAYVEFVQAMSPYGVYVFELDLESGELGAWEKVMMWDGRSPSFLDGGESGYDFLWKTSRTLYGKNFGEELVPILDYETVEWKEGHDLGLHAIDEGVFLSLQNFTEDGHVLYKLVENVQDETEKKQVIVIGAFDTWGLADRIIEFNQNNKEWQVELVQYQSAEQLNLDIANGKEPDILWMGQNDFSQISYDSYVEQGLLEDLTYWFEQDPGLNTEEFLTNVFDAMGTDGKWYRLCTAFGFTTYMGKKSVLSEYTNWTLNEMKELEAQNRGATAIFARRENLLRDALIIRWDQFVNEDGSCDFSSQEFIGLLEWIKDYPSVEETIKVDILKFRNNEILVSRRDINSFGELILESDKYFGEETISVGFPGADGIGGTIVPKGNVISMFSRSENKEGAWEFVRYYFTDEYQNEYLGQAGDVFAVKRNALEAQIDVATDPQMMYVYFLDGKEYVAPIPKKQVLEGWIDYMESITCAELVDTEVYNIIMEEAEAFFADQKSAEDVANIIQSRAWIYLAEQQ